MYARLLGFGLGAFAGWLAALALFAVYVNHFSETGRSGDWAVLSLAWFAVAVGLFSTVAFAATLMFAIADQVRRHA